MIKYFCDKCGKELQTFDELTCDMFAVTVEPPEVRKWSDDAETGTYILCSDCTKKLNKWIRKTNDFVRCAPQSDLETLHIPEACKSCSNHPSNGGSGICNCTLGNVEVKC